MLCLIKSLSPPCESSDSPFIHFDAVFTTPSKIPKQNQLSHDQLLSFVHYLWRKMPWGRWQGPIPLQRFTMQRPAWWKFIEIYCCLTNWQPPLQVICNTPYSSCLVQSTITGIVIHSCHWCCISSDICLSISIRIVADHTQHLSDPLSMPLPEEDPWSFANVFRLLHEAETHFTPLASPQGILKKSNLNYLWLKKHLLPCRADIKGHNL